MKRRPPSLDRPYRKHRLLSQEESRLWRSEMGEEMDEKVEKIEAPVSSPRRGEVRSGASNGKADAICRPVPNPPPAGEGNAPPLDARTRRKIVRGRVKAEATLDLHGHHRPAAHAELVRFIEGAQARGISLVLVITGKGRNGRPGVLREELPRWLSMPPLRDAIIAYDTAGPGHGGEGAWYVRIRKRKPLKY